MSLGGKGVDVPISTFDEQPMPFSPRLPSIAPRARRTSSRDRLLRVESLEDRTMLHHDPGHTLTSHIHARLNIFIEGERYVVPKDVGIATGLIAPIHTHDVSGKLHVEPAESTYPLTPPTRFPNVGDFFEVWRTNGGNAGNNANAIFTSTNILGHVTDATHKIRFFVNGVPNTEFQNYILRDNDEITISYDQVAAGASANAPIFMPIDNYYTTTQSGATTNWGRADRVDVLSGSPLYVPLDGYDPNQHRITYTATSSNPNITVHIPTQNRALVFDVANFGKMKFHLFDDKAPRVTNRIADLAGSNFYDGTTFHRVIANFMSQGGDPTATGTGGSTMGDFDDQFHVDLQHNRTGLLSMAKSNDDTNDSQFFMTDVATRHLDYNHSIFGLLTQGDFVRDQINSVDTNASDKPLTNVVITSVRVIDDLEDSVLMIKPNAGYTGDAVITVTATDPSGNTFTRTFDVRATPDTINSPPFLTDFVTDYSTAHTVAVRGKLASIDVENTAGIFDRANPGIGWSFVLDPNSGNWTFTPQLGVSGIFSQLVGVRDATSQYDIEEIMFTVAPPVNTPTGVVFTTNVQTPEEASVPGFAYSLVNPPTGMTINSSTGVISWTPTAAQKGQHTIEVRTTNTSPTIYTQRNFKFMLRAGLAEGDLNQDNAITRADLSVLVGEFGRSNTIPSNGDVDGDGHVGLRDLIRMRNLMPAPAAPQASAVVAAATRAPEQQSATRQLRAVTRNTHDSDLSRRAHITAALDSVLSDASLSVNKSSLRNRRLPS